MFSRCGIGAGRLKASRSRPLHADSVSAAAPLSNASTRPSVTSCRMIRHRARAERRADADLALTFGRAREQERRDVRSRRWISTMPTMPASRSRRTARDRGPPDDPGASGSNPVSARRHLFHLPTGTAAVRSLAARFASACVTLTPSPSRPIVYEPPRFGPVNSSRAGHRRGRGFLDGSHTSGANSPPGTLEALWQHADNGDRSICDRDRLGPAMDVPFNRRRQK